MRTKNLSKSAAVEQPKPTPAVYSDHRELYGNTHFEENEASTEDELDLSEISHPGTQGFNVRSTNRNSSPMSDLSQLEVPLSRHAFTLDVLAEELTDCCPPVISHDLIKYFLRAVVAVLAEYELTTWSSLSLDMQDTESVVSNTVSHTSKQSPSFYIIGSRTVQIIVAEENARLQSNKNKVLSNDERKVFLAKLKIDRDNFKSTRGFVKWFKQSYTSSKKTSTISKQLKFAKLLSGFIAKLAYCKAGLNCGEQQMLSYVGEYIFSLAKIANGICSIFNYVPVLPELFCKQFPYAVKDTSPDHFVAHTIGNRLGFSSKNTDEFVMQTIPIITDDGVESVDKNYEGRIQAMENKILDLEKDIELNKQLVLEAESRITDYRVKIQKLKALSSKEQNDRKLTKRVREMVAVDDENLYWNIVEVFVETMSPVLRKLKSLGVVEKPQIAAYIKQCGIFAGSSGVQGNTRIETSNQPESALNQVQANTTELSLAEKIPTSSEDLKLNLMKYGTPSETETDPESLQATPLEKSIIMENLCAPENGNNSHKNRTCDTDNQNTEDSQETLVDSIEHDTSSRCLSKNRKRSKRDSCQNSAIEAYSDSDTMTCKQPRTNFNSNRDKLKSSKSAQMEDHQK